MRDNDFQLDDSFIRIINAAKDNPVEGFDSYDKVYGNRKIKKKIAQKEMKVKKVLKQIISSVQVKVIALLMVATIIATSMYIGDNNVVKSLDGAECIEWFNENYYVRYSNNMLIDRNTDDYADFDYAVVKFIAMAQNEGISACEAVVWLDFYKGLSYLEIMEVLRRNDHEWLKDAGLVNRVKLALENLNVDAAKGKGAK